MRDEVHKNVADGLNTALGGLEDHNAILSNVVGHIDFTRQIGGKNSLSDKQLRDLIKHFDTYRLRNEDFEFPDLLGAAYEYLIKEFADSAGKKGGEFYTPRDVVKLLVRLLEPKEGMRIYDPCVGSGGMLIVSRQYLEEHGGDVRNIHLYGQENNGTTWAICKMNMLLHGIRDADIKLGDTLAEPQHRDEGRLMRFDRVIRNPPFSQNYDQATLENPERFRFGFAPETGKKADLMFVQHMVSVLREGGRVATVMPHGVLFRGGAEKTIREGMLKDDLLEAVIGLAPNLFYGTGIPACILVLRAKDAKPQERKSKVLFINADRDYYEGRAQNYLRVEHLEKIVSTFKAFKDVPRYASVVTIEKLAENDYNLNIRRYADDTPPPEPQDVRAHLVGGIPLKEIEATRPLSEAHGFDPMTLFKPCGDFYAEFKNVTTRNNIKNKIEHDEGVKAKESALQAAFEIWWHTEQQRLTDLPKSKALMDVRGHLLDSFDDALDPVGILDMHKVDGVIASWWEAITFDLKTVSARGFKALVESWTATIQAILEDEENTKDNPLEHKLVKHLMGSYLEQISQAESKLADFEEQKRAFEAGEHLEEAPEGDEEQEVNYAKGLEDGLKTLKDRLKAHKKNPLFAEANTLEEEIKTLEDLLAPYQTSKKQIAEAKKHLSVLRKEFAKRLNEAAATLDEDTATELCLRIFKAELGSVIESYATAHRREVVQIFETLWDKYSVSLKTIEEARDEAAQKLRGFMHELGYE